MYILPRRAVESRARPCRRSRPSRGAAAARARGAPIKQSVFKSAPVTHTTTTNIKAPTPKQRRRTPDRVAARVSRAALKQLVRGELLASSSGWSKWTKASHTFT